jgi:hypothetical protein
MKHVKDSIPKSIGIQAPIKSIYEEKSIPKTPSTPPPPKQNKL